MRRAFTFLQTFFLLTICPLLLQAQQDYKYKNPKLNSEDRTQDLLGRMTLEEKVGQLLCPLGWEMYEKQDEKVSYSKKFEKYIQERHIGMLWATFRADPWTRKTLENGLNPQQAAEVANVLQRYAVENTRLGIPVFLAEEAPHGHMAIGTTVFPAAIGLSATWNPLLIEKMGRTISKEVRLQGAHISYGPVIDLAREPRWSRVEETFGEDPFLSGTMGAGFASGLLSEGLTSPYGTISTLKHFIAYGVPEGGHNGNSSMVGMRELHETFLPPFQMAIKAGALSVMTAYNSVDGIPCTSNKYLLTDVLNKWQFRGFSVSDLGSIEGLKGSHKVAASMQDAAQLAVEAGLDVDLGGNAFFELIAAVKAGRVSEQTIDRAVSRVLRLKFEMGLFENPYVDTKKAKEVRSIDNIALAREVARQSITLLKNENNILPLSTQIQKVAVIGPNADNMYNQLGDYTAPQDEENIITVLQGVRNKLGVSKVEYVKGCAIRDTSLWDVDKAIQAVKNTDVAIVVVGGSSARDFKTKYIDTGAAVANSENQSDMESGEGYDRASLDLMGKQLDLLKAIKGTGVPVVVVYIAGRPLNMNWADENADALLMAWYPGQEGGNALADVIFGDYNPAGRLSLSVPRSVGQLPVYYNRKNPFGHAYVEMTAKPLYTFGYGLSYTTFKYEGLKIIGAGNDYTLSFTLSNVGNVDGDEVVQLYIRDEVASVVRPIKQLRKFERVHLKKGEHKTVRFSLSADDFSLIDNGLNKVVEPGDFTIEIGASSDDIRLNGKITIQ